MTRRSLDDIEGTKVCPMCAHGDEPLEGNRCRSGAIGLSGHESGEVREHTLDDPLRVARDPSQSALGPEDGESVSQRPRHQGIWIRRSGAVGLERAGEGADRAMLAARNMASSGWSSLGLN